MMQAIPGKPLASLDRPQDAWLDWFGRMGLYALLLFYQLNATVAYVGLGLTIVVFAVQTVLWMPLLRRDPVVLLYLALVIVIFCHALSAAHEIPETAPAQWLAMRNWMHWLAFIPVAWVVRRNDTLLNRMLLLLAAGLMARILLNTDWSQLGTILHWPRTGFGLTMTVFAPLAGISALGVSLLAPRLWAQVPAALNWTRWALAGLCVSTLAVLLESLVLSQTRGVWLAAAAVFPFALAFRYGDWLRKHALRSVKSMALLGFALLIVGLFIWQNYAPLIARIQSEPLQSDPAVVKKVVEGKQEVMMTTAIGYRVIMWRIGWQKWTERPWLGWGPGSSEWLLEQAGNPLLNQHVTLQDGNELTLNLSHLHNLYLEILVRFGALGAVLFFALPILLLRGVGRAYSQGKVPWDYVCFIFAGWGFTAIVAFSDFQIFKFAWRNYCVIWAALTYAVYLAALEESS